MANFKVSKKDALSDTRTNIYDLHEKKLEYFELEKSKLNDYHLELKLLNKKISTCDLSEKYILNKTISSLENKIENIENDTELNEYLLEFITVLNEYPQTESLFEDSSQKGIMDSFVNSSINTKKTELYNGYIKKFNPELDTIHIKKNEKKVCTKCQMEEFYYDQKIF